MAGATTSRVNQDSGPHARGGKIGFRWHRADTTLDPGHSGDGPVVARFDQPVPVSVHKETDLGIAERVAQQPLHTAVRTAVRMRWINQLAGSERIKGDSLRIAVEIGGVGHSGPIHVATAQRAHEFHGVCGARKPSARCDIGIVTIFLPELLEGGGPLSELRAGFRSQGSRPRGAKRRQNNGGENGDDRHHPEQFDDREASEAR